MDYRRSRIDDAAWDAFTATPVDIVAEDILETYQAAYDHYMNKLWR